MEGRTSPSAAQHDGRRGAIFAYLFCVVAALCATYLSGLNFPEQNNRWHIPIVLDFAGSAEGPHDAYHQSFGNFISLFWIAVRSITTETNIEAVFVAIQLIGNVLLACAIFTLLRQVTRAVRLSALVTGFLCFCYGLWGATPLGYSEIFVTYATHTQYASTLCLFGIALVVARRPFWAAVLFGVTANINLFMAAWGAMAGGLTLLFLERRIGRNAIIFALLFLLLAGPIALWGLRASTGEHVVPYEFLRDFLKGHAYGFDYPRALTQTFALGIAAGLACQTALSDAAARRLGTAMLASMAVLAIGVVLPYLTKIPQAALLHPLRFTSVVVPLAAICAGALFIDAWRHSPTSALFPAAMALAGFMLKLPLLSLFGLALVIPQDDRKMRMLGVLLALASILALFLPAPATDISSKMALAFVLTCLVLAASALLDPASAPLPVRITGAALGGLAVAPFSALTGAIVLLAAIAALLCFAAPRWRSLAAAAAGLSCLVLLFSIRDDSMRAGLIAFGTLAVALVPMITALPHVRPVAKAGLVAVVLALMLLGLANGARDRFAPDPTPQQRDFLAAQQWARGHVPPDTMILAADVDDGFSLMSRRPVWWEPSYAAAILWQPAYFPLWSCRKAAIERAATPRDKIALARREGIAFIVTNASQADEYSPASPVFRNAHYAILEMEDGGKAGDRPAAPACPE